MCCLCLSWSLATCLHSLHTTTLLFSINMTKDIDIYSRVYTFVSCPNYQGWNWYLANLTNWAGLYLVGWTWEPGIYYKIMTGHSWRICWLMEYRFVSIAGHWFVCLGYAGHGHNHWIYVIVVINITAYKKCPGHPLNTQDWFNCTDLEWLWGYKALMQKLYRFTDIKKDIKCRQTFHFWILP